MATRPGGDVGGASGGMILLAGLAAALASMLLAQVGEGRERQAPASQQQFGTVREASCSAPVQTRFDRAVALLHSFEFGPASDGFDDVARADPFCGIASWGLALAAWGNPFAAAQKSPTQIRRGQEAIDRGRRAAGTSEREKAYIAAAAELYRDAETSKRA